MNFLETARGGFNHFLYGDAKPIFPGLPNESLRYIRDYGGIGINELRRVICQDDSYNLLAPYYALKLLDAQPFSQRQLLQQITGIFSAKGTYADASGAIDQFFATEVIPIEVPINPNKLRQIMIGSPEYVKESAAKVANEVAQRGEIPVVVAYAGFVALRDVVCALGPEQIALIVFPDKIESDGEVGYKLTRVAGTVRVDILNDTRIPNGETYALIDNTTFTGQTFDKVTRYIHDRNPHTQVTLHPLYMTRSRG